MKKGVLRNFAKFTVKHLYQSLLFNKVAGVGLWHRYFPVNFVKFLRPSFFIDHLLWLPLQIYRRQVIPEFYQAYPFQFSYGYESFDGMILLCINMLSQYFSVTVNIFHNTHQVRCYHFLIVEVVAESVNLTQISKQKFADGEQLLFQKKVYFF